MSYNSECVLPFPSREYNLHPVHTKITIIMSYEVYMQVYTYILSLHHYKIDLTLYKGCTILTYYRALDLIP